MIKYCWLVLLISGLVLGNSNAERVWFSTSTNYVTTGALLTGTKEIAVTTNVQEIAGLLITAGTTSSNYVLSANSRSFGVNTRSTTDDEASRFDAGEVLILSFNKAVEITFFDLRNFESGEYFTFSVDGQPDFVIDHDKQDSTGSDYLSTNLVIAAHTDVRLFATTTGNVGFEALDITVLEESRPLSLSLTMSNSTAYVFADFDGAATTNYVLQSSTNLTTNVWTTVSAAFAADTNLLIEADHDSVYYRVIAE